MSGCIKPRKGTRPRGTNFASTKRYNQFGAACWGLPVAITRVGISPSLRASVSQPINASVLQPAHCRSYQATSDKMLADRLPSFGINRPEKPREISQCKQMYSCILRVGINHYRYILACREHHHPSGLSASVEADFAQVRKMRVPV